MSQCRSCGSEIVWSKTVNGKSMPLDAEPVTGGNVLLLGEVLSAADAKAADRPLYTSHFATCPDAPEHRRAR